MPKESRRTKMTRYLLNDSFWQLLAQKPLGKITVKEICQTADINRSTYYRYYTDPYDQAQQQEKEFIEAMLAILDRYCFRMGDPFSYERFFPMVKDTLDYIYTNRDRFWVLMGGHCGINLQTDMAAAYIKKLQLEESPSSPKWESRLRESIFCISGSFAIVYHWLQISDTTSTAEVTGWITDFLKKELS